MSYKILVIDDHSETLRLITLVLERHGFIVSTATNGQAGIQRALTILPDLILLDIMMPMMSGIDVCRALRAEKRLDNIPIVMFSARSQIEDKNDAYAAGADEYIVKPTRPQELIERVQAIIDKQHKPPRQ